MPREIISTDYADATSIKEKHQLLMVSDKELKICIFGRKYSVRVAFSIYY